MEEIANKIKEKRKELKLTQIEVSVNSGVAKNSCRRIEAGFGCTLGTLIKICDELGLKIEVK